MSGVKKGRAIADPALAIIVYELLLLIALNAELTPHLRIALL